MSNQTITVRPVGAFTDNYIWLIEAPRRPGAVVAVDPGEAGPVQAELERSGHSLAAILLTHHHPDHIGGVRELLDWAGAPRAGAPRTDAPRASVPVIGPDDPRVSVRTLTARDGERCELPDLGLGFDILHVPGHTLSHIAFWGHGALFCGDTLFSAGCGRMFEGTPVQMIASLNRLRSLPQETKVYCGHEYTAANLRFALTVEPENPAALEYQESVAQLRARGAPSLPSRMSLEIRVNPFLRCEVPAVRAAASTRAGRALEEAADVFGVLRAWKDQFR